MVCRITITQQDVIHAIEKEEIIENVVSATTLVVSHSFFDEAALPSASNSEKQR